VRSRTPDALNAVPRLAEDAAASEPALHQRREPDTATPCSVSREERLPVLTSPRALRDQDALTAPHRHKLIVTVPHPRHARKDATASKPRRQRHGRKLGRAQLLRDLVEVADQPLIDDRLDNELDRSLCRSLDGLPRLLDRILHGGEGVADAIRRAVEQRLDLVPEPVRYRGDYRVLHIRPRLLQG